MLNPNRKNYNYFGEPCVVCGKPVDHKWYSHRRCKRCNSEAVKANYNPLRQRNNNARLKFGVDLPEMLKKTPNCGICNIKLTSTTNKPTRFAIDHCHKTGKVRGLLCNKCNRGLGLLQDSKKLLAKAFIWLDF